MRRLHEALTAGELKEELLRGALPGQRALLQEVFHRWDDCYSKAQSAEIEPHKISAAERYRAKIEHRKKHRLCAVCAASLTESDGSTCAYHRRKDREAKRKKIGYKGMNRGRRQLC